MRSIASMALSASLGMLVALPVVLAQAPGAAAGPPAASASADSTSLPGDNPPRGGGMGGPPGGAPGGAPGAAGPGGPPPGGAPGAGGKPPQEPGSDAPSPSLALALEAAQAAIAACLADGYKIGVSVIDSAGQPRVSLTADGATGGHTYTAVRKGLAALAFKVPTSQVAAKLAADKSAAAMVKPNMMTWAGAVPLMKGGKVIGAIGGSGASSQQDEKCAQAGADKIKARLK